VHRDVVTATLQLPYPVALDKTVDVVMPRPETDYLMTLELSCEPGHPMGQKLVVNCPGGSAHGPKINGTLIPPAGDWLTPVSERLYRLDVRGTLKTDDGELVLVEYGGVISTSKEAFDRFAKGEVIAAKDMYVMTALKFSI
jgi:hypothetical protein